MIRNDVLAHAPQGRGSARGHCYNPRQLPLANAATRGERGRRVHARSIDQVTFRRWRYRN